MFVLGNPNSCINVFLVGLSWILWFDLSLFCFGLEVSCDAPKPGCPLTTHQPAENLYVSYYETHTYE